MGRNCYGQLVLGDNEDRNTPTCIPNIKAKQIVAGYHHTVVIDWSVKTDREEFHSSANNVWTCGCNRYGQLGLNDTMNRNTFTQIPSLKAKQIAAGEYHTVIFGYGVLIILDNWD